MWEPWFLWKLLLREKEKPKELILPKGLIIEKEHIQELFTQIMNFWEGIHICSQPDKQWRILHTYCNPNICTNFSCEKKI